MNSKTRWPALLGLGLGCAVAASGITWVAAATLGTVTSTQIDVPKNGLPNATPGAPYGRTVTATTQTDNLSGPAAPVNGTFLQSPNAVVWDASASVQQDGSGRAGVNPPGNGVAVVRWIPNSQRITLAMRNLRSSPTTTNDGCGVVIHAAGSPNAGTGVGNAIIVDRTSVANAARLIYGTFSGTTFTPISNSPGFTVNNNGSLVLTYGATGQYTMTTTIGLGGTWTIGVPTNIAGGRAGFACFADSVSDINSYTTTSTVP